MSEDVEKTSESREHCASREDLPCIRCGYNLRELSPDGQCPECGTPIRRSRHGDLLSTADPAWLVCVSRGVTFIYAAVVIYLASIVLLILFGVVPAMLSIPLDEGRRVVAQYAEAVLEVAMKIVPPLLVLLGIFALTTPDPRLTFTEQPVVLRRIVRGAAIAGLAIGLLRYGLEFLETADGGVAPFLHGAALWTFRCMLAITWVVASYYVARLGERIPDMKLAKLTKSRARGFAVCLVLAMLVGAVHRLFGSAPSPGTISTSSQFLRILVSLFTIASFVYAINLMSVWVRYRKPIKRCLLEAREMGAS